MKTVMLLAIGLSLLLAGCASGAKNEAGEPAVGEDTTASNRRARPRQTIAPGTAEASARVQGYDTHDHHYVCSLQIKEVTEYGAGTPALPVGTEINVVIPKALFGDDPGGAKAAAMLATDQIIALTLKHQTAATAGDAPPSPRWRALALR